MIGISPSLLSDEYPIPYNAGVRALKIKHRTTGKYPLKLRIIDHKPHELILLSYRHAFHAGNYADLLKHIVQVEILTYMTQKDKAFDYIDTHAGAGMYAFDSEYTSKNKEYLNGIGHWFQQNSTDWPEISAYLDCIRQFNPEQANGSTTMQNYPGSPSIAEKFMRPHDKAWLYEMHSTDYLLLQQLFAHKRQVKVQSTDGFQGLLALLPCQSRRAFVLIDPSYELKEDYHRIIETISKAHKKMPNTVFALWYPVVERSRIEGLQHKLQKSGIKNILQFELGISPDNQGFGMTSAGMFVINPPWTLFDKMQQLLPKLAKQVSSDKGEYFRCEQLVAE